MSQGLIGQAGLSESWRGICSSWRGCDDYLTLLGLCRDLKKLRAQGWTLPDTAPVKIAVLGTATTDLLIQPLRLALAASGIEAELHVSGYGQMMPEMMDALSATAQFAPAIAIVLVTPFHIHHWPAPEARVSEASAAALEAVEALLGPCRMLHQYTGCEIILNNFHGLPSRQLGNLESRVPGGPANFIRRVNLALADAAPPFVHIHDVCGLAERKGLDKWFDVRDWHESKQPVAADNISEFVRGTASIAAAILGRVYKCAVVDLDNTLWHGVIGDDGVEGIQIGQGSGSGEAFLAFQIFLKSLRDRGVLLAVSSKNELSAAELPFLQHRDMVLKRDDFVAFRANWLPKSENIRSIAAELNIGLDSIVFIDDNPAERDEVRQALPEVAVPEMTADSSDYPAIIERGRYFEAVRITAEDRERSGAYASRAQAAALQSGSTDYPSYLRSLSMKAVVRSFDTASLERITQLINKSNQFNVTTRRLTLPQVRELAENPAWVTRYIRLKDRFGDHGLIGVVTAEFTGNKMFIRDWLMSCRVLSRTVEALVYNELLAAAVNAGAAEIVGTYIPTKKNALVKNLYPDLGFRQGIVLQEETSWLLNTGDASPRETFIEKE